MNFDPLPRGITGVSDRLSLRRSVDPKLFKAACHRVALQVDGSVSAFDSGLLARNYYVCTLRTSRERISVLGNATYPVVGFVRAGQYGFCELSFLPCPDIDHAFRDLTDFVPLHCDVLNAALTMRHLSALAAGELAEIKHWQLRGMAARVGDVVFNAWD